MGGHPMDVTLDTSHTMEALKMATAELKVNNLQNCVLEAGF